MTADRQQIIAKLRDWNWYARDSLGNTICRLDWEECKVIIAALQAAEAAERQVPVAWLCDDDLAFLQRDGECTIYQERQEFTIMPAPTQHPLYAKPSGAADGKAG